MDKNNLYTIELDKETCKSLTLCLFFNVQNTKTLREIIKTGTLECCGIKASLIHDPFQVTIAANIAAMKEKFCKLITKSVHTEILYNLSMSTNISRSLQIFGIEDDDTEILLALVHKEEELDSKIKKILDVIDGQIQPISNIKIEQDLRKIIDLYKLSHNELKVYDPLDLIITRICIKDFTLIK